MEIKSWLARLLVCLRWHCHNRCAPQTQNEVAHDVTGVAVGALDEALAQTVLPILLNQLIVIEVQLEGV